MTMDTTTTRSGKATYTNTVTGETYKLGFDMHEGDTELGRAWKLVKVAASMNGWNVYDVTVKSGI